MKYYYRGILIAAFLFVSFLPFSYGNGKNNRKHNSIQKNLGIPSFTHFNINNISTLISDEGNCDYNLNSNIEGIYFPKGSKKNIIYESGFLWGGKVNGDIRIGGSTYLSGLQPGKINPDGTAQNPQDPSVRVYRVRTDYATANLTSEINDGEGTAAQIRAQYKKDWNEWPASDGAPYQDVNGDGKYEPDIDIPGVPGADQTIYFIANDLDAAKTTRFVRTNPVGLELHVTVWGYKGPSPFDNMIFKKYQFINKSGKSFNDVYFEIWSDPDIGDANDDVAGCDSVLNLGYTYNYNKIDQIYGNTPPAVGFTVLQGPVINGSPSDSAFIDGRIIPGEKNLPMTSYAYYNNNVPLLGVELPFPPGYFYNVMQGKYSDGNNVLLPSQFGGGITLYPYSGDPVKGTGYLDNIPLDKRIMVNSGPFNMAPGDTQEIVFAEIFSGGFGSVDNLKSVGLLKLFTENAISLYKDNFLMPAKIPAPNVTWTGLDREVILSWGNDIDSVNQIENFVSGNSRFQGYNVYQLPSDTSSLKSGVRIATFDLDDGIRSIVGKYIDLESGDVLSYVEQYGTDSGIQRYLDIKKDTLTGEAFKDGSKYYFAVTAYTYDPSPEFFNHSSEGLYKIITVVPQSNSPGVRYEGTYGERINVIHSKGNSEGRVQTTVIDPSRLTGDTYKVMFSNEGSQTVWSLIDSTTGKVKLQNQTGQTGTPVKQLVDGMQISVSGPAGGVKNDFQVPIGDRRFTWANSVFGFEGFNGAIGWASPAFVFGNGTKGVPADSLKNVLLVLAQVTDTLSYNPSFNESDTNMSYGYRYGINFNMSAVQFRFAGFITNRDSGFAYQDFKRDIPLSAWDVEDPLHPRRLALGFTENNSTNGLVDGKYWPPAYNLYSNTDANGPREWLWIFNTDYSATPNPQFEVEASGNPLPVMYFLTVSRRGPVPFSPFGSGSDQFLIEAYHVNSPNDVFTFTSPAVLKSIARAKQDVYLINVFPNPYYGYNAQSNNRYRNFVTFSHLPQKAVIRIFNLAGTEVTEIDKDNPDQFQQWYLYNNSGIPLASGLYIAYIEMPELGVTKILKIAIIQPQAIPERY